MPSLFLTVPRRPWLALLTTSTLLLTASCGPATAPMGPPRGPLADAAVAPDACAAQPCAAANTVCVVDPTTVFGYRCDCGTGFHVASDGSCSADPCDPNPCLAFTATLCSASGESFTCACDPRYTESDGTGGCRDLTDDTVPTELEGADFSTGVPTFTAQLRVVDGNNQAVYGALVKLDATTATTDLRGMVAFPGLPFRLDHYAQVVRTGFLAVEQRVTYANSGTTPLVLRLVAGGISAEVSTEEGATLQHENVAVIFPRRALAASPRTLASNTTFHAVITAMDPQAERPDGVMAGEFVGESSDGAVGSVVPMGYVDVSITTNSGAPATLAMVPGASLAYLLPAESGAAVGDTLPLWFFDAGAHRWRSEGECVVGTAPSERQRPGRSLECAGSVHHFTPWIIARSQVDACIRIAVKMKLPRRYKLLDYALGRKYCLDNNIETCALFAASAAWRHVGNNAFVIAPRADRPDEPLGSLCTLSHVLGLGSVWIFAHARARVLDAITGKTTFFEWEVSSTNVEETSVRGFRWAFGRGDLTIDDREAFCLDDTHCSKVVVDLTPDLARLLSDEDGDGYLKQLDPDASRRRQDDCDDSRADVHPEAFEDPCDGVDGNCDGVADRFTAHLTLAQAKAANLSWAAACQAGCAIQTAEVPGNFDDENCDGVSVDGDGDGYLTKEQVPYLGVPLSSTSLHLGDCNDFNANVHPGATEVVGNDLDEDCDGMFLDADNDGYLDNSHLAKGIELGSPGDRPLGDCDDHNPKIHPGVPATDEAYLAGYFFVSQSGVHVRRAEYCGLFDAQGRFTAQALNSFIDRNCDGYVTDLDGDIQPTPGDPNFGAAIYPDCDDTDPRFTGDMVWSPLPAVDGGYQPGQKEDGGQLVECLDAGLGPEDAGVAEDAGAGEDGSATADAARPPTQVCGFHKPTCLALPAEQMANESECTVDTDALRLDHSDGNSFCPPVGGARTKCIHAVDGSGHEVPLQLCVAPGWDERLPESPLGFGAVWGPCDLTETLPACPSGTQCGGDMRSWNSAYMTALQTALDARGSTANVAALPTIAHGMCFPLCQ